jgi:nucleotide-binding universal stress UspA family protein
MGHPAEAIVRVARERGVDLIVIKPIDRYITRGEGHHARLRAVPSAC